jgi:1,4-dihydroxy-2-naphthoyl-CoA hydrolase
MATATPTDLTSDLHHHMPYAKELGLEVLEATADRVRARTHWTPQRCTSFGLAHGGFLMAVADSAGGLLTSRNLPSGAGTTTIESKTNLLRGVRSGEIVATAEPVHVGRTTIVVTTRIHDEHGKLVAQTTQTQLVLQGAAPSS